MEHKIFQHLLELKSLQIRSTKANESLLVKRAVDDYHKSTMEMGGETGVAIRRYPYKEYTFKNFEIFLYEVLKSLQKSGTNNFQNISDVYLEVSLSLCKAFNMIVCVNRRKRISTEVKTNSYRDELHLNCNENELKKNQSIFFSLHKM